MAKEEVVESTTIQVIETLCDKVGPVIKQVAESLGTSSEQIMVIFTRQAFADAVDNFINAAICIGIAFAWMKFSKMWSHKIKYDGWDKESGVANIIISPILYFITLITTSSNLTYGVKRLINPEYYAFTEVLTKVTELIGK